ncbi:MAG: fructose-1,6-bisphosphatase [Eubacteriales bacterium]|nr:fructose-1,6-bisphosphatase [Eubacteriales bacterium]MDY3332921.1 fructose-1,6-bisphosphatase [Gallibacter sp.]
MNNNLQFLNLLSNKYPNRQAASAEIINLNAILALPKGTEYYFSDLHGEFAAFRHMVRSASGIIRQKIDYIYEDTLSLEEREHLASLIYDASEEIRRQKMDPTVDYQLWCKTNILRLINVCKEVSRKYTRSKLRQKLPKDWGYSIDELIHTPEGTHKERYYAAIVESIIETGMQDVYILQLAKSITRLCVDKLHIIGDVFDRGAHPDFIMDYLMEMNDIDFQWGNHDIVWMGAAAGNWACTANILRMNIGYNNFDMLEIGYGINLRPLTSFANRVYANDPCTKFTPKVLENNIFDQVSSETGAKMHKAISIIQFKVEGQLIKARPNFDLEHRRLLHKIDFEKGTITINGKEYELNDTNFPTIDPADPYKLTIQEERVMNNLQASISRSPRLHKHITFMLSHGALYKVMNRKLMFHGCVPSDEEGNFISLQFDGEFYSGKNLFDYFDRAVREAYYSRNDSSSNNMNGDIMWYLWLGAKSPLFGKDQMTTFERLFIDDKASHKENTVGYYTLRDNKEYCEKILEEFGLDPLTSHILNGHVPVKIKDGENPIKGGGKLFVIDGGISKAYQKTTGIAGYTFIYNSKVMMLAEHKPYSPLKKDGTQKFHQPKITTLEKHQKRLLVKDTDQARVLEGEIESLKTLIEAYRKGIIKEN